MVPLNHPPLLSCSFQGFLLPVTLTSLYRRSASWAGVVWERTHILHVFCLCVRVLGMRKPFSTWCFESTAVLFRVTFSDPCGWHGCECAWWVSCRAGRSRCTATLGEKWNQHWNLLEVRNFGFNTSSVTNWVGAEATKSEMLHFLTFLLKSSAESLGSPSSFFSLEHCLDTPYKVERKKKSYNNF